MPLSDWTSAFENAAKSLISRDLLRVRKVVEPIDAVHLTRGGRALVNFSSNNYLGLSHHPRVIEAMQKSLETEGVGAAASGLISGFGRAHQSCEQSLAKWKGTEAAVLLPSGYQANHAIIQTLAAIGETHAGGVRFLMDKLCHASLIDAVRGSGAEFRIFPHNGIDKLARLLDERTEGQLQVVVTESIFSMDGDAADLKAIVALKKSREFLLLVDEAHGGGVYGNAGAGWADEIGVADQVDITVATLSKAISIGGGAICSTRAVCDAVVNFGRAYIYSTAIPPVIAAGIQEAIGVLRDEPHRAARVLELAKRVRSALSIDAPPPIDSPIIPIPMGTESAALEAAQELERQGMLVVAVRPPTVPRGGSRLRVTVSSEHSDEDVESLIGALAAQKKRQATLPVSDHV